MSSGSGAGNGGGVPAKRRVAAASDLHCRPEHGGKMRELVKAVNAEAELLLICGDLTDRGQPDEAKVLADALSGLTVPCAAVFGNHDLDRGVSAELAKILGDAGVEVLDGDHLILVDDIGVAGVKGFMGGFGSATLQAFGEVPLKAFVQEAVSEALKLEAALSQLDTDRRIVIMHYTPIVETTVGENVEIRAFLGSSRLAAPIDLYGADVVFHGHAHHGALEGRTTNGTPVYNVAMPLLKKLTGRPFLVIDV
ncbi:metallophosphoesterase [Sorangium sp. So ce1036]|uniref:metallophosphoesterase family protein n=1 Tax=Sorangium sp. So ce1036 TaxID=3133328 RepID=UPI003F0C4166